MKSKHPSRSLPAIPALLAAGLAIVGCMLGQALRPGGVTSTASFPTASLPTATATDVPTPTATPLPRISIRLMAYNILFGAGVSSGHAERGNNLYRLEDLISVVKQADPDILGLEEVTEWDTGNPKVIDQFARAVGMKYYMAPTWRGINPAIFSKYPILETENLSDYLGNNGALRAVVQMPDGQKLNVVIAHLDPKDHVLRACQFDKLRHSMAAYQGQTSILMGDINTYANSPDARHLTSGGWQVVQTETIDNIFVLSPQAWSAEPICFGRGDSTPGCVGAMGISDHLPVGAVLSLYSFPNPASLPTPAPAAEPALPPEAEAALSGLQVLSVTDNTDLPGCADATGFHQFLQRGQAALMRLRIVAGLESKDSKASINLDSGLANEAGFLRFSLGIGGGGGPLTLRPYVLTSAGEGSIPVQTGSVTMNRGQWYYVLIAADKHGAFRTLVWDSVLPAVRMQVDRPADPSWVRDQWRLFIEAVDGELEMSEFQLLSFESFP